jgi:hypothetical protein
MLDDHNVGQTAMGQGFHAFPANSISRCENTAHGNCVPYWSGDINPVHYGTHPENLQPDDFWISGFSRIVSIEITTHVNSRIKNIY